MFLFAEMPHFAFLERYVVLDILLVEPAAVLLILIRYIYISILDILDILDIFDIILDMRAPLAARAWRAITGWFLNSTEQRLFKA